MFDYELTLRLDGTVALTQGGEVIWTSDNDDEFLEEFGEEVFTDEDADDIIGYLTDEGYIPPRVDVHVVDECDSDDPLDCEEDEDSDDDQEDDYP